MRNPIFSVITPTSKRHRMLKRAIQSVLNQTFANFELIVVDDAKDSKTIEIVERYNDKRIILIQHEQTRGAAASYNTGLRASTGEYITFLDDDDEYLPLFLEKMNATFKAAESNIGFIWTGISRVWDTSTGEKEWYSKKWPERFSSKEMGLMEATSIGNGFGLCIKRECIEQIGFFDESLSVCEDTDFMFRLAERFHFITIPEILVKIHHHKHTQLTDSKYFQDRLKIHEKILSRNINLINQYPGVKTVHYQSLVNISYKNKFNKNGRKFMIQIIKSNPLKISHYLNLIGFEIFGAPCKTILRRMKQIMFWK